MQPAPLDRDRFSAIAHATHTICNPVAAGKVDRVLEMLDLPEGARAVDVGAGKGEVLARACNRFGVEGVAVERSPLMAQACRAAAARLTAGRMEVVEMDAARALAGMAPGSVSLVLCLGSLHALGGFEPTLKAARTLLGPGGWLLLGEGYWKQEPSAEYLAALGGSREDYGTHAETIARIEREGFLPRWAVTASDDDWDEYEWRFSWNVEAYVEQHPEDPHAGAMLQRSRTWRTIAQRWGRSTLGFGLYLARRP